MSARSSAVNSVRFSIFPLKFEVGQVVYCMGVLALNVKLDKLGI
jgi:hypothetical protein